MLQIYKIVFCRAVFYLMMTSVSVFSLPIYASITMQDAIRMGVNTDSWLVRNQFQERSLRAASNGADSLPEPRLSMGMLNLPTDGFNFGQEPMTQFKVGLSQLFPRGDSLKIKQQQLRYQADRHPYQREDRKAKLTVTISQLWLDALKAEHTIRLI
ncbi:MAG: TolC family protein, partial [Paraglaciecola sp.]|nr:TolC family protein [Paraglaciecola sp.]